MTEEIWVPSFALDEYQVKILLDNWEILTKKEDFNGYIKMMRDLKKKSFITCKDYTINKMHIVYIKTTLSPILVHDVNSFIHQQSREAFDKWMTWEEAYTEWCEKLPWQRELNKILPNRKRTYN